jgi:hypothetical protein
LPELIFFHVWRIFCGLAAKNRAFRCNPGCMGERKMVKTIFLFSRLVQEPRGSLPSLLNLPHMAANSLFFWESCSETEVFEQLSYQNMGGNLYHKGDEFVRT